MANEIKQRALELYSSGLSCREVVDRIDGVRSLHTILNWVRSAGISRKAGGSKHKWPFVVREQVQARYLSGECVSEIIPDYDSLKQPTVAQWLRLQRLSRRRGARPGCKNPAWKNGVTPLRQRIRTSAASNAWRLAVLDRDGFRCCHCGKVGGELHVHHILSFSLYPLLRMDINNGITLCQTCHSMVHGRQIRAPKRA